jgi:hypothetical protein
MRPCIRELSEQKASLERRILCVVPTQKTQTFSRSPIFQCFVLALADGLCYSWLAYPICCLYRCPEIGSTSLDWAQLSRFYMKTETESSLRNVMFMNKNRMMDNIQKYNIFINVPSSQTLRSYLNPYDLCL